MDYAEAQSRSGKAGQMPQHKPFGEHSEKFGLSVFKRVSKQYRSRHPGELKEGGAKLYI